MRMLCPVAPEVAIASVAKYEQALTRWRSCDTMSMSCHSLVIYFCSWIQIFRRYFFGFWIVSSKNVVHEINFRLLVYWASRQVVASIINQLIGKKERHAQESWANLAKFWHYPTKLHIALSAWSTRTPYEQQQYVTVYLERRHSSILATASNLTLLLVLSVRQWALFFRCSGNFTCLSGNLENMEFSGVLRTGEECSTITQTFSY